MSNGLQGLIQGFLYYTPLNYNYKKKKKFLSTKIYIYKGKRCLILIDLIVIKF